LVKVEAAAVAVVAVVEESSVVAAAAVVVKYVYVTEFLLWVKPWLPIMEWI